MLCRFFQEWLAPRDSVIVDVYHPAGPMLDSGQEWHLEVLEAVPSSVAMIERCHYDPVHARWIDEWQPVEHPENTLAQTISCYTPADLLLLLEGTGLSIKHPEIEGEVVDLRQPARDWQGLVQTGLQLSGAVGGGGKIIISASFNRLGFNLKAKSPCVRSGG